MKFQSSAFLAGEAIPPRYTCDGENISPPLAWEGVPEAARSLVLIVDDPDAPDPAAPKMTWVHWVLYNLPATAAGLVENAAVTGLPPGTRSGLNDWKRMGYGGPCPPIGQHRYFFKLYALDKVLPAETGSPDKARLLAAMRGHILASTELVGVYRRP